MKSKIFICELCNFDKFHICEEGDEIFISCAHCGIRTDIDIKNLKYLKTNSDNL